MLRLSCLFDLRILHHLISWRPQELPSDSSEEPGSGRVWSSQADSWSEFCHFCAKKTTGYKCHIELHLQWVSENGTCFWPPLIRLLPGVDTLKPVVSFSCLYTLSSNAWSVLSDTHLGAHTCMRMHTHTCVHGHMLTQVYYYFVCWSVFLSGIVYFSLSLS